jgi:hypothetical protein
MTLDGMKCDQRRNGSHRVCVEDVKLPSPLQDDTNQQEDEATEAV